MTQKTGQVDAFVGNNVPEGPNFSKMESFQDLIKGPLHLCEVRKHAAVMSACKAIGVGGGFFLLKGLASLYFFH